MGASQTKNATGEQSPNKKTDKALTKSVIERSTSSSTIEKSKINDESSDSSLDYDSANEDTSPRDDVPSFASANNNLNSNETEESKGVLIGSLIDSTEASFKSEKPRQKIFNVLTESFETPDSSVLSTSSETLENIDNCEVGEDPLDATVPIKEDSKKNNNHNIVSSNVNTCRGSELDNLQMVNSMNGTFNLPLTGESFSGDLNGNGGMNIRDRQERESSIEVLLDDENVEEEVIFQKSFERMSESLKNGRKDNLMVASCKRRDSGESIFVISTDAPINCSEQLNGIAKSSDVHAIEGVPDFCEPMDCDESFTIPSAQIDANIASLNGRHTDLSKFVQPIANSIEDDYKMSIDVLDLNVDNPFVSKNKIRNSSDREIIPEEKEIDNPFVGKNELRNSVDRDAGVGNDTYCNEMSLEGKPTVDSINQSPDILEPNCEDQVVEEKVALSLLNNEIQLNSDNSQALKDASIENEQNIIENKPKDVEKIELPIETHSTVKGENESSLANSPSANIVVSVEKELQACEKSQVLSEESITVVEKSPELIHSHTEPSNSQATSCDSPIKPCDTKIEVLSSPGESQILTEEPTVLPTESLEANMAPAPIESHSPVENVIVPSLADSVNSVFEDKEMPEMKSKMSELPVENVISNGEPNEETHEEIASKNSPSDLQQNESTTKIEEVLNVTPDLSENIAENVISTNSPSDLQQNELPTNMAPLNVTLDLSDNIPETLSHENNDVNTNLPSDLQQNESQTKPGPLNATTIELIENIAKTPAYEEKAVSTNSSSDSQQNEPPTKPGPLNVTLQLTENIAKTPTLEENVVSTNSPSDLQQNELPTNMAPLNVTIELTENVVSTNSPLDSQQNESTTKTEALNVTLDLPCGENDSEPPSPENNLNATVVLCDDSEESPSNKQTNGLKESEPIDLDDATPSSSLASSPASVDSLDRTIVCEDFRKESNNGDFPLLAASRHVERLSKNPNVTLSPMSKCGDLMGMSPVTHHGSNKKSASQDEILVHDLLTGGGGSNVGTRDVDFMMDDYNDDDNFKVPDDDEDELFKDPSAFDYLLKCGNGPEANAVVPTRDFGKESLFVKFDPLVRLPQGIRPGREAQPARIEEDASTASGLAESCSSDSSAGPIISDLGKTSSTMSSVEQNSHANQPLIASVPAIPHNVGGLPLTDKPTQVVPPAKSARQQYRPCTPPPAAPIKNSAQVPVSPAIAVIDRLINLGLNTPPPPPVVVKPKEPEMDPQLLNELQSVKELFSAQEQELNQANENIASLKQQLSESNEREQALIERVNEKNKNHRQMSVVMEEYERTMSQLISEREVEKRQWLEERASLIRERDEVSSHLANIELSFNDTHVKYERCKTVIQTYKTNEDILKQTVAKQEENLKKQMERYEQLRQHAMSQLEKANQEIDSVKKSSQAEIIKYQAMLKKSEIQISSLQESLAQKTKNCEELTSICDELINKFYRK